MKPLYFKSVRSMLLFGIQYISMAVLMLSGSLNPSKWYLLIFVVAGLILGFWSIIVMGWSRLNAGPDPLPGASLVMKGPYSLIRHPMYTAILLVFIPLVINDSSLIRIIILATLIINLVFKIHHEEQNLLKEIENYGDYSRKTRRLIPWVY